MPTNFISGPTNLQMLLSGLFLMKTLFYTQIWKANVQPNTLTTTCNQKQCDQVGTTSFSGNPLITQPSLVILLRFL